ncbi:MAG: Cof-type HAD-IIB family hydrolase [Lachnospiraceae bacterium]|nr:Cof-type HAD-IIB family hydrolase [Lachnospiraceae bacterium]
MQKLKMVALDLDGTLLTDKKEITKKTLETLKRAARTGTEIVIATGRSVDGIPAEMDEIPEYTYAVTCNGSAVYNIKTREPIYEDLMEWEEMKDLFHELWSLDVIVDAFVGTHIYRDRKNIEPTRQLPVSQAVRDFLLASREDVDHLDRMMEEKRMAVNKFSLNFKSNPDGTLKDRDKVMEIASRYPEFVAVSGGSNNVEFTRASATKGTALIKLGEYLHIKKEEIMACGDSGNDMDMLSKVGFPVAMANAEPQILEICDYVTLSNEEDGVAAVLEKFVLEK